MQGLTQSHSSGMECGRTNHILVSVELIRLVVVSIVFCLTTLAFSAAVVASEIAAPYASISWPALLRTLTFSSRKTPSESALSMIILTISAFPCMVSTTMW